MGKTTKKARQTPPLSADRVRTGWQGPAGTRIRLARAQERVSRDTAERDSRTRSESWVSVG